MSRTIRNKRKTNQKVKDGTSQYSTKSCSHHGGCPICEGNRLHSTKRRVLVVNESLKELDVGKPNEET